MRSSQTDAPDKNVSNEQIGSVEKQNLESDTSGVWCESCGSPIPAGVSECPVCGLPVTEAFNDHWDANNQGVEGEQPEPELASALPPAPKPGEPDEQVDDIPTRTRLVIISVIAALIVVGGTTLFITRPWDPEAYITHTKEETDISKERTVEEVSHLSGQDYIADAKREQYLKDAEAKVAGFLSLMNEVATCCDEIEASISESFERGELPEDSRREQITQYKDNLKQQRDEVAALDLRDSVYQKSVKQILVVAEYLEGRVETLCSMCEAIDSATDPAAGVVAAENMQSSGWGGRSLEEWRDLFRNAYAGLEVEGK